DGPGEFVNILDPHLEVYDPAGVLIATGVVLADGRNESVSFTAAVDGDYRIRVVAENGTHGEYVLSAGGGPGLVAPGPALGVADGGSRSAGPTAGGPSLLGPASRATPATVRTGGLNIPEDLVADLAWLTAGGAGSANGPSRPGKKQTS